LTKQVVKESHRLRLLEYRVRRATILLELFDVKANPMLFIDENTGVPYIKCKLTLKGEILSFRFPLNKLGRRYLRELWRLDKGCFCGTIRPDDVKVLFVPLSVAPVIYKYRSMLRRHTGLVKDEKLRNWIIWRRIQSVKLMKSRGEVGR